MATATEDRAAFLAERRTGIGGSDAAAVCGLNPWHTPHDVFLEKLDMAPPKKETPAMRWGNLLEDAIADEYATQTGRVVRRARGVRRHKKHRWMLCHLDRLVTSKNGSEKKRIVEAKSVGKWANLDDWGEEGTDEIPDLYLTQAHHNLTVADAAVCDMPFLIAGQDFRIYSVAANPKVSADLIEIERVFWKECVEKMRAPDAATAAAVKQRWPFSRVNTITGSDEDFETVLALLEVRTKIAALEEQKGELETLLKLAITDEGDALKLDGESKHVAKWKTQTAYRFDAEAFRAKFPDLHAAFRRGMDSRPFRFETKVAQRIADKIGADEGGGGSDG